MARIPRDNRSSDDRTVVCGWRGCRRIPGGVVVHSLFPLPPVRHSLPHRGPGDADLIPDPVMLPRHPGAIIWGRVLALAAFECHAPVCPKVCLLYTSDAADEEDSVDLGGRRIIKKKKKTKQKTEFVK
eukprot:TRINITY_DN15248_c0_g1_i10.p1 TRINITY_DN15248_c0_g1~~TRINITY_DN15248_c0_g1_i10.p1  ORF type:complete len:128 (-),score=13.39 TRINITY_DN15248_c0_g1_i10:80-463(-)